MSSKQQDLHIAEHDRAQEEAFIVPVRECHDRKPDLATQEGQGARTLGSTYWYTGLLTCWASLPPFVSSGGSHSWSPKVSKEKR